MYFVITSTDRGILLQTMDKELLIQRINEGSFQPNSFKTLDPMDKIDLTQENGTWIIEGKSVVPNPISIVERYEI